jgi:CHASE3 domain sensor protein
MERNVFSMNAVQPLSMTVDQKKRTLIGLALAAPLVLLLLLTLIALQSTASVEAANATVLHTYRALSHVDNALSLIKDAETGQRGYLLTARAEFLEPYTAAIEKLPETRRLLAETLGQEARYAGRLELLDELLEQKLAFMRRTIETRSHDPAAAALLVQGGEGKRRMDEIRRTVATIVRDEKAQLALRLMETDKRRELQYHAALGILAADVLILGLILLGLYKLRQLQQLVTICAWTREIRHEGRWLRLEEYLKAKFNYDTSHGLSERAAEQLRTSP